MSGRRRAARSATDIRFWEGFVLTIVFRDMSAGKREVGEEREGRESRFVVTWFAAEISVGRVSFEGIDTFWADDPGCEKWQMR